MKKKQLIDSNKHRHAEFATITRGRYQLTQGSADLQLQILVELDYFIYLDMVAMIIYINITFYIVSFFNSTIQC